MLQVPGIRFVVSCEHASNAIPAPYAEAFAGARQLLDSHEGYDAGALQMGRDLARALGAPLVAGKASRLLIDLNRSPENAGLHSPISRALDEETRRRIRDAHYRPYRHRIRATIERRLHAGERVIHVSSHSFTPELHGVVRDADIGLLYDPEREGEATLCHAWQESLAAIAPSLHVRGNYPYTGTSDGLTTALRGLYAGDRYLGIEIEVNQKHVFAGAGHWRAVRADVIAALLDAFARHRASGAIGR